MFTLEQRPADSRLMVYLSPLLALGLTLLAGALLFLGLGQDPAHALYTFFLAPLTDAYGWAELGIKTAPLLLCAMGLTLCFRARVWNIGAEGQLLMGALGGGYVALLLADAEGAWVLPVVLLSGIASGALWAGMAALLKAQLNTNEILTTIMLNYIALNLLVWAVHGPLKDPFGFNFPQSAMLSSYAMLPELVDGYRVHLGLVFALLAVAVIWTLLARTFVGFQISVLGQDEKAARFAGFRNRKLIWLVLLVCGGLAGLAGISEVAGPLGQLVPSVSPGYGYAAIIVVFMGRMHPVGILLASALLGLTFLGGEMVQMDMNLPKSITGLFQGMLLFFLLGCDLLISYRIRRKAPAARLPAAGEASAS